MALCTFGVTGRQPYFQEIYACYTCCDTDSPTLCLCQACAQEDGCHSDHDVRFVGMGPCYCDCGELGKCKLVDFSIATAKKLGCHNCVKTISNQADESIPSFDIYHLHKFNDFSAYGLIEQAKELVRHSKSTFWLDHKIITSQTALSGLEKFAWKIFEHHVRHYKLAESLETAEPNVIGAEWWVQTKQVTSSHIAALPTNAETAIDLHYDKDEKLAEVFDLGFFPSLSTVSYWGSETQQYRGAAPTVVFKRHYTDAPDEDIKEMLLSHPAPGKHLVFDGGLLHGAPSHEALRQANSNALPHERITFLVNIWIGHRPCDAAELPALIRDKLVGITDPTLQSRDHWFDFVRQTEIDEIVADESSQSERIQLPFVGGSSTWADQCSDQEELEESEDEALQVDLLAPSPDALKAPSVLIRFSPGNEAFIA